MILYMLLQQSYSTMAVRVHVCMYDDYDAWLRKHNIFGKCPTAENVDGHLYSIFDDLSPKCQNSIHVYIISVFSSGPFSMVMST